MTCMFGECKSLSRMPDLSKWDVSNVNNMSKMFALCSSLVEFPDISKWDVSNCFIMVLMFAGCESLSTLPNISNIFTPFTRTYSIFQNCFNLCDIPDKNMIYDVRFLAPF